MSLVSRLAVSVTGTSFTGRSGAARVYRVSIRCGIELKKIKKILVLRCGSFGGLGSQRSRNSLKLATRARALRGSPITRNVRGGWARASSRARTH